MTRVTAIEHRFVDTIPKELDEGVLYISIQYTTAVHRCLCGRGNKVTTPIRPQKWHLEFDGERVSLDPSIGNFSFPCQSHYWIRSDRVYWSDQLSKSEIDRLRIREKRLESPAVPGMKPGSSSVGRPPKSLPPSTEPPRSRQEGGLLRRMLSWRRGR